MESPRGVNTNRKNKRTREKNMADTMSKSFHWRGFRLDAGRFKWPMVLDLGGDELKASSQLLSVEDPNLGFGTKGCYQIWNGVDLVWN